MLVLGSRGLEQRGLLVVVSLVAFGGDGIEDVLDDEGVDVLGDLVEQEEVAEALGGAVVEVGEAGGDDALVDPEVGAGVDDVDPHVVGDDGEKAVDEPDPGDCGEEDEPEVEEDVDLLVDDVEREDAEGVMLLESPGGAVLLEVTLGHLQRFY